MLCVLAGNVCLSVAGTVAASYAGLHQAAVSSCFATEL